MQAFSQWYFSWGWVALCVAGGFAGWHIPRLGAGGSDAALAALIALLLSVGIIAYMWR